MGLGPLVHVSLLIALAICKSDVGEKFTGWEGRKTGTPGALASPPVFN